MAKAQNENIPEQKHHRTRMREKFTRNGFDGFLDYEVLEYLLFHIFRQGDTKPIARSLIKRFGSFAAVLDASVDEIARVDGMGENSALGIKAFRKIISYYFEDIGANPRNPQSVRSVSFLVDYARARLGDRKNEILLVILLNASNEIIDTVEMSEGTVIQTVAFPRRIAEAALKANAVSVIICHNHPGGNCKPSENDIRFTRELSSSLLLIDITLHDHIVISDSDYFSFARNCLI